MDESAVRKLTQIRHRLISVAQASANRVRSTAWLDSDGVLRENTTIKSDAKIRGMQVKSYIKPPAGFSVNQCHFKDLPYKRTGTVELAIYPTDGRHGTYFLSDIAFEASRSFLENNRFRKDWTLNSIKKFNSNYEKAIATASSVEGT